MNKMKVTTRKASKSKTKKESQQVFVLPPNLLEKLGINLGNYGSTTGNTTNSNITDINVSSEENGPCKNILSFQKDSDSHVSTSVISSSEMESSSIIETAELMKKSVFLSPTFISNNTSTIQGEIEIVGNIVSESIDIGTKTVNNECDIAKNVLAVDLEREYVSISDAQKLMTSQIPLTSQENEQCGQIVNGNVDMQDIEIPTLIDDHADEAYSSDCSSSNTGCTVKPDINKSNENKIHIISEQIIFPSQLYKLKISPKNSSLIHVPMNTMIKNHATNSIGQDDLNLNLIPIVTENIETAEKSVIHEYDMYEQNFINRDDFFKENVEVVQNPNKSNTTNKDSQEELESTHKQFVTIEDTLKFDTAVAVPCNADHVNENNIETIQCKDFNDDRNISSGHDDHAVKQSFEVEIVASHNKINVDSFSMKLNNDKPVILIDKNNTKLNNIETDVEPSNSYVDQHSLKNSCLQNPSAHSPGSEIHNLKLNFNNDSHQEAQLSDQESTAKQMNVNLYSTLQNTEFKLTNGCDNITTTIPEITIKSSTCRRPSKSISKISKENTTLSPTESLQISQCDDNYITADKDRTRKEIVYFKTRKTRVGEEQDEREGINRKDKLTESNDNGSVETNKVKELHINNAAAHEDKIREIAKYLSEFADLKKRSHFTRRNNMITSKTMGNKKSTVYSKSSIQGVEKPGGTEIIKNQNFPPTKTYERKGRQRLEAMPSYKFNRPKASTQFIDVTDNSTTNIFDEMEVCLCHDFGRLMSYDDEDSYEHIHFWSNSRTDCTPDVLFSIYNEDAPVPIDKCIIENENYIRELRDYPSEVADEISFKMCWSEIKHVSENECIPEQYVGNVNKNANNEEHEVKKKELIVNNLQDYEGMPNDKTVLNKVSERNGQKRKLSTILADNDEPPAKNKKPEAHKHVQRLNLSSTDTEKNVSVKNNSPKEIKDPSSEQCNSMLFLATGHQGEKNIPVKETTNKQLNLPSASINNTKFFDQQLKPLKSPENKTGNIVCGVCQLSVEGNWIDHIASKHDYRAWKSGEPPLDVDDEIAVREHLDEIAKVSGRLTCKKCGLKKKSGKTFLSHMRRCSELKVDNSAEAGDKESVEATVKKEKPTVNNSLVKCGVCEESMQGTEWNEHIASRHDYLAWKSGEIPLDVADETAVKEHLYAITKACGGLTCAKCGLTRKYVKAYLSHVRSCTGLSESQNDSAYDISSEVPKAETDLTTEVMDESISDTNTSPVKCGVCEEFVQADNWSHHIASQHGYMAWKHGETPLDVKDEEAVRNHLYEITRACGGLTCAKCGLTRKYVKAYLSHIKSCHGLNESQNDSTYNITSDEVQLTNKPSDTDITNESVKKINLVECAVCKKSLQEKSWNSHIASEHDYLAWKVGDTSLDVNNDALIRDHLSEMAKACGGLTCSRCGVIQKHVRAYLSHIRSCHTVNKYQNDSNISTGVNSGKDSGACNYDPVIKQENNRTVAPPVKCGVCEEMVEEEDWYEHIGSKHDYLAWKSEETALEINDEAAVKEHLYAITNACGGLTCSKCGLTRKYVKSYQTHFKTCNGVNEAQNVSTINTSAEESGVELVDYANTSKSDDEEHEIVKCGVCLEDVRQAEWFNHIASRHTYLAWKEGEERLDVNDNDAVRHHLVRIKTEIGRLKCAKCCTHIKTAKKFMIHVKSCKGMLSNDLKNSSLNRLQKGQVKAVIKQPEAPAEDPTLAKCGVCGQYTAKDDWIQHIATSHNYLAWREGEPPLNVNDEQKVRAHLRNIIIENGNLTCQKCDLPRKYVKSYLLHLEICDGLKDMNNENKHGKSLIKVEEDSFKCGVCSEVVISLEWAQHLSEKHDYLAWREGDTPVSVDDEEEVYEHLFNYTKQFGYLHCKYCGKDRKYVKSYLEHIKYCKNGGVKVIDRPAVPVDFDDSVVDFVSGGTCAICHEEVEAGKWIHHTQKQHNYLAWREGDKAWNVDDFEDLNQYLYVICKRMDGLTCNKCGLLRKYVKTFLTHIKKCDADVTAFVPDSSVTDGIGPSNQDEHQCAMCKEILSTRDWKSHAMEKHYNVTWIVGETPIDIKNVYVVERLLKEYKQVMGTLKCNSCGLTRASYAGFYGHIIVCNKTEEEIDMYRSTCEICDNKYLCIYKSQHAMIHKVQMLTAEAKIQKAEKKDIVVSGKRRAAVKARSVIENYSDNMSKHLHSCKSCGFGTDFESELKMHKCEISNEKDFSADEDSDAEVGSSDDESGDTDVDSNISNEVNDGELDDDDDDDELQTKKKRYRDAAPVFSKVTRIPFKVEYVNSYIREGATDFCNTFLTDEVLFPQWQGKHEPVRECELTRYLPPIEHSCKFKSSSDWRSLKRFEASQDNYGTSIFVGASIVCVAWVPPRLEDISEKEEGASNFLAVTCHNGPDCPRYHGGETPKHENLIQIWDFNNFNKLPELVLGIAHDFGTVWSMDWCPSGARGASAEEGASRLGLLAVACSSGSVYIFAVPYPSRIIKDNQIIWKLNPVAELRMTMGSERKIYQATSVSWSKQKEHKLILVGYADGSTAYYDLHTESPLLSTVENDVQVFHPYYDERPQNTCITGTDLYPVAGDAAGGGCGAWSSPTGAELAPRAGAGAGAAGRARLAIASQGVAFVPHAGCAVLSGDDAIMQAAITELVWVPPGRRIGGTLCAAGCARCGRVACSMPPTLRVMRLHPSYCDAKKQVIGLIEMTHLAKKRNKKVNDELAMIIEPLTYEDTVSKYGIEFTRIGRTDRALQQQYAAKPKSHCPERFPLADVESMAFCPSKRFHDRLAVATHSGILFLINTN